MCPPNDIYENKPPILLFVRSLAVAQSH